MTVNPSEQYASFPVKACNWGATLEGWPYPTIDIESSSGKGFRLARIYLRDCTSQQPEHNLQLGEFPRRVVPPNCYPKGTF